MADLRHVPTEEELKVASVLNVIDSKGQNVSFGSIYATQKTTVVFIRHFFCGRCQEYVEELAKVTQETLESSDVKIVVIGCGNWQPIEGYAQQTGFTGPIYADPSRKVYHALGMNIERLAVTPASEKKRSYLRKNAVVGALLSSWRGPIKNPGLIGKQGNLSQLGGDFVFGPGNTCSFASRMQHTEDHVEVQDLLKAAGISES
ncbi:hypothetical protein P691DRAFT_734467 [Macrolepiota fuliginosa MF-IS2]|uniref:Uncharacterized protein n=1 Tax=Macrolepiota fuliginosa MF-IS2 TaxID=1400762 RepID=A0A9P6C1K4_9AGAR|nr:hypothetical protein P691DRAFT_734467 [Macrolepiota fuliginosa MF-IS2]